MKRLTISDIFDKAVKDFEVDFSKTPKTFEESAKKKIRKMAQTHPKPGNNSFYARAKSSGTKTDGREFSPHVAEQILSLCRPYFSRYSANEYIRNGEKFRSIRERAESAKENADDIPSYEDLKEMERLSEEAELKDRDNAYRQAMYAAFYLKYNREPVDEAEYMDSGLEPVYIQMDPEPPGPVSKEELELFYSDYHYTLEHNNWEDPHMITSVVKRSYDEAIEKCRTKKFELMLSALYDLFFEPIDEKELVEDIHRDLDPHIERWDEAYFSNKDKLQNASSYCRLKKEPVLSSGFNQKLLDDFKRDIMRQIGSYFGDE